MLLVLQCLLMMECDSSIWHWTWPVSPLSMAVYHLSMVVFISIVVHAIRSLCLGRSLSQLNLGLPSEPTPTISKCFACLWVAKPETLSLSFAASTVLASNAILVELSGTFVVVQTFSIKVHASKAMVTETVFSDLILVATLPDSSKRIVAVSFGELAVILAIANWLCSSSLLSSLRLIIAYCGSQRNSFSSCSSSCALEMLASCG